MNVSRLSAFAAGAGATAVIGFGATRAAALQEGALLAAAVGMLAVSHAALRLRNRQRAAEADARAARADLELQRRSDECDRQRANLEAFSRLASHVAHEVRNPLNSIGINLELLEEEFRDCGCKRGPTVRELVKSMKNETDRLREFTDEYLAFARPPRPALEPEDLNEVAEDLASLLREEALRSAVIIEVDTPALPVVAPADRNQVKQAAMNLVRNAIQAMPEGGRVTLRTRADAPYVILTVSDTGPGVPEEVQCRVFEPFFSTKKGGTGLGLPLAQHIAREHGGELQLRAAPGGGACFSMLLPAAHPGAAANAPTGSFEPASSGALHPPVSPGDEAAALVLSASARLRPPDPPFAVTRAERVAS